MSSLSNSDTLWGRSHSNRNHDPSSTTTTTITSLGGNNRSSYNNNNRSRDNYNNHHDRRYNSNSNNNHNRRSRSRSYSKSRSRSRSHSRSINDSMSRSPSPKRKGPSNRHNDRDRKRSGGGSRSYHSRRPRRHARELPYPSRSRSTSRSKSRSISRSRSRSPSYSNDSDGGRRRHRRHRRDNYRRHRHGHRGRDSNGMRSRHGPSNRGRNNDGMMNNDISHSNNGHDSRGNGTNNHKSNVGVNDKVPVSFKEFTNQMLEDDVTAQEAQKRYEKYLQRFSKSDDVLFFEAHKDEEWFQERYDPIIIEKSIEARRENARKHYWKFYEQFLNDQLPDIHDNIQDFKSIPNTIKPSTPMDDDEDDEEDMNNNNSHNDNNNNNNMRDEGKEDKQEGDMTTTTTTTITTTTTTTTIGGGGNDEQIEGQRDDDEMDIDDNNHENNNNNRNNNHIIPDDGKLRLPKYADFMYKDDYEPHLRESSPLDRYNRSSDRTECYQNSIFIQGIPLHIQREKILTPFQKFEGFEKLILSDPIRNSRKVRYGWVTFNNQENCRKALQDVADGGLNGHQLTGQYFMNLLPKQKSKRRPKFSPPESLYPHRVLFDIKQTHKLAKKFDQEAGIKNNPLLREDLMSKLSEIRRLNLLLIYLRRIHFLCYYCGKHFLSEEHMFARCSGTHERKVPADISLAMSGNIDIDHNAKDGGSNIIKKDKTSWEKDLDQRINDVINYVIDHKRCWIERKQIKMLEKNTKKVSEGKFRCTICSKLFKAEVYVEKHIKNKHQDEIAKYIADQRLRTMFENYRRDRDRLTIKSFEDNDDKNSSNKNSSSNDNRRKSNNSTNDRNSRYDPNSQHQRITAQQTLYTNATLAHPAALPLRAPPHPHLMIPTYTHPHQPRLPHTALPPNYPYPSPLQAVAPANPLAAPPTYPPSSTVPTPATAATAVMAAPPQTIPATLNPHQSAQAAPSERSTRPLRPIRDDRYERGGGGMRERGGGGRRDGLYNDYEDPYGRKIPIHYQEDATRTRRSYREVDIEYPQDEAEEEIDYGFGDFVKNPAKFNL